MKHTHGWLLSIFLCGCGGGRPIGTMRAAITSSAVRPLPIVRVAVLWSPPTNGIYQVAQEIEVKMHGDQLPVRFKVDVTEPPEEAMGPVLFHDAASAYTRTTWGRVFVYEDGNGNGRLDLIGGWAQSAPDRILGMAEDYHLLYYDGEPPRGGLTYLDGAREGLNIVYSRYEELPPIPGCDQEPRLYGPNGLVRPDGHPPCDQETGERKILARDTEIPIALTADRALARELCSGPPPEVPSRRPDCINSNLGPYPPPGPYSRCPTFDVPPPGTPVVCSDDGTAFVFRWSVPPSPYLCAWPESGFGSGVRNSGDPIPAGWPCP